MPIKANDEITSICQALCIESNPWPLKRFLKDPDERQVRHYSLYHNPVDSPNIIKAVPLKSLLSSSEQRSQKRNPYVALSAKQRFGIAATLAWSVLHLSCSPWLDEHWDQKQMALFVEKTRNGREIFSRYPCASCVFSPRTCQDVVAPSDKFKDFVPNRTVFALGILLIELCISESVSDLEVSTSLVDTYKYALNRLDEVYLIAGDSYGDATARCVKFSFEGRDVYNDFDFAKFRQQFYDVVVAPVQATYLTYPDSHYSL